MRSTRISPATNPGVAVTVVTPATVVAEAFGVGDAPVAELPDVGAGVAATVGRGVEEADDEPVPVAGAVVTLNPPMRKVTANESTSQMKYWVTPAIADSTKRRVRASLEMNLAIGAARMAPSTAINGLNSSSASRKRPKLILMFDSVRNRPEPTTISATAMTAIKIA